MALITTQMIKIWQRNGNCTNKDDKVDKKWESSRAVEVISIGRRTKKEYTILSSIFKLFTKIPSKYIPDEISILNGMLEADHNDPKRTEMTRI